MRWLVLLLLFSSYSYSQVFIQTFTDRCTGETKVIQIPSEGATVIVFYNQSRTITLADYTSGELQTWMEEVYAWWRALSPCSTNQATTTAATTATTNATQNATSSTAGATASATPPPTTETQTTNTETSQPETTTEPETTSEPEAEPSGESEETSSEDSGSEGESEDDGDDSSDGEESEEEDNKSDGKPKRSNPIIVAANMAVMSSLDGAVNSVMNFGLSQSSLNGYESYSAGIMVWDNLKQFNINLSKSYIQKEPTITLYNIDGKPRVSGGSIEAIQTSSIGFMYMYGSITYSYGKSFVWPLKNNLIAGTALSLIYTNKTFVPITVGFATKPYIFSRVTVSPMLAIAATPVIYNNKEFNVNKSAMFVIGSSNDFSLTKSFRVNLGWNIVKSTTNLPMTWSINIGSKFQF